MESGLSQILEKVHQERDFNFLEYKESSVKRRVERRLRATKSASYNHYISILDSDPTEYTRLIDDLTIKVSEFFRNSEAWEIVERKILPAIIENKKTQNSVRPMIRIWSAGCATGQEVYTAAILAEKCLKNSQADMEATVFGTDVDKISLYKAHRNNYGLETAKTIPADVMDYFEVNENVKVKGLTKARIYFQPHNMASDKALAGMDLIICRNVIIYFERSLQERLMMNFCNELNDGGYLFLGKAEVLVGPAREKFEEIDKKWRIYRKINKE